jgi:FtsP/CotA-like multicopper oxidase with cupredoxin domain
MISSLPVLRTSIVAVLLAAFLSQSALAQTGTIDVEIHDRKVTGERVIRVKQGDTVRLKWSTDETVELHLHGYDIETEATPDKPAVMSFTARATGRFPVTSHGFGEHHESREHHRHGAEALLYIEVYPR